VPLIKTEDFTPLEVKEIAEKAVEQYKKLSMISYVKCSLKTLDCSELPRVLRRFFENLSRTDFTW